MDFTELANANLDGMNTTLGLRFTAVTPDAVEAEVAIGPHLHQPYGIVHGGVYATIAETVCSIAAGVNVIAQGKSPVGLDNHTSFLRAARSGVIRGRATPVHRGRQTHVWTCELTDGEGRVLATSRVRLLILDQEASLAGEVVSSSLVEQIVDPFRPVEADESRSANEVDP